MVVSVDHHVIRPAMDAALSPIIGWQLTSECTGEQSSYQVVVRHRGGDVAWDSGVVASNASANVPCTATLKPATAYSVAVAVSLPGTHVTSDATPFVTRVDFEGGSAPRPIWHPNASAQFVLLRKSVARLAVGQQAFLAISARPTLDRYVPHGSNSSHLLCAYKLWIDGVPLGVGPGRKVGGAMNVDTYNITALLGPQANRTTRAIVAVESYFNSIGLDGVDDGGGVVALLHDGSGRDFEGGDWLAFDATDAFQPSIGPQGLGQGDHSYFTPLENLDASLYPHAWRVAESVAGGGWVSAIDTLPWADGLVAKQAMPVALRDVQAAGFVQLPPAGGARRYLVDFGRNFQGGLNVSFSAQSVARALVESGGPVVVNVRLGEQLKYDCHGGPDNCTVSGVLPFWYNDWSTNWTLGRSADAGSPDATFTPHEYAEFRYAELTGAPEPPTTERVRGWAVRYPFDGDVNEGIEGFRAVEAATQFESSDAGLNQVWELARWTVEAAAIDLNTDSNTRQRDVCTLDAFLTTLYQGGTFPASSFHHRRRVVQFMFEPLGYVNTWTEFLTSVVGGLAHLTFDFDDAALAVRVWDTRTPPRMPNTGDFSIANYSLSAYFDADRSLVTHTPKPLIDWPRSAAIDINSTTEHLCDVVCAQMNAHAVTAQTQAAYVAGRLGRSNESQAFAARAAAIRSAAQKAFAVDASRCTPSGVGPCFTDTLNSSSTTAQATGMAADARLAGTANGTLALVPFMRARNERRGAAHGLELSGWQALFMLRGVYSAASEVDEGPIPPSAVVEAAQFAMEVLTNTGMNSWLGGMIGIMGATMTTESWIIPGTVRPYPNEGGATMSHPWTAAPAVLVPRWLMGVRPLSAGWERLTVRPMPPPGLRAAATTVPTPRGAVALSFAQRQPAGAVGRGVGSVVWEWDANVTVPGNTRAQICAPLYAARAAGTPSCESTPSAMVRVGALLCLADDVVGGTVHVNVQCRVPV